ncbi:glycosyltransferase [Ilumatobacter nonamiensis]|uniref:glycosyltransferase n=1 Tax=Ilumatobacter nonamiensis TaxID=467093 RepID=UPI000688D14B|nr:glycosyltransferase family 2 protein [Ilumatobacter nonamiensis]
MRIRTGLRYAVLGARVGAATIAVSRLARAARVAPPVAPASAPDMSIGVVIPARDEADRIGPLLDSIVGAPGVDEVIVVDDQSTDDTSRIADDAGASVVAGTPLPPEWAGKAWALQQGLEAASADWVVTLDADTRPDPSLPTAVVARAMSDHLDFLTVGGRFECPTPSTRWLHASMLTTLVYRFGPPGIRTDAHRAMANGQCMVVNRTAILAVGGLSPVASEVVEDVALARHLSSRGWSVGFLDAADLLSVRMFESLRDTWSGWGRSLALPGVEPRPRQLVDLAVVLLAQALPLPRLLLGRGDIVDVGLLVARLGTLNGTRSAYDRADLAYWLSPLADLGSAAAIARGIARRGRQTWRGRAYA